MGPSLPGVPSLARAGSRPSLPPPGSKKSSRGVHGPLPPSAKPALYAGLSPPAALAVCVLLSLSALFASSTHTQHPRQLSMHGTGSGRARSPGTPADSGYADDVTRRSTGSSLLSAAWARITARSTTALRLERHLPNAFSRHLLRACRQKLSRAASGRRAERELRGVSSTREAAGEGAARVWQIPALTSSPLHDDLGWVVTRGEGLTRGRVNEQSCFSITVKRRDGSAFDQGCLQRAAFIANLTSDPDRGKLRINIQPGLIRLAADVTYLPESSSHRVCYVAPNPGVYRVQVRLMFTNAFLVQTTRDPANLDGFARYAPVIQATVDISAASSFSLLRHRQALPPCSLSLLSRSRNQGFWLAHTWLPLACRLRRVSPSSLLRWLHGKNILFLGDSEMRYAYGFLQSYATWPSRDGFWKHWSRKPQSKGSELESVDIPRGWGEQHPVKANGSDTALHTKYEVATGQSVFVGSRYSGFGLQHLQLEVPAEEPGEKGSGLEEEPGKVPMGDAYAIKQDRRGFRVNANLSYISFFDTHGEVVEPWMLDSTVTGGVTPIHSDRPFDVVIEGSILHAVLKHESVVDYGASISSRFLPQIRRICPTLTCKFVSFGPLAGLDEGKPDWFLHKSNNVRNFVFEEALHSTMMGEGFPNMLHMSSVTVPVRGSELTCDLAHYRAPVQLAMIDLVFGSLCSEKPCEGRFV